MKIIFPALSKAIHELFNDHARHGAVPSSVWHPGKLPSLPSDLTGPDHDYGGLFRP